MSKDSNIQAMRELPAGQIYGFQIAAAVTSSFLVAPLISIVDKAIFSNASGKEPLWASMANSVRSARANPMAFLKGPSFLWIWAVYGGTYVAANTVETVWVRKEKDFTFPKFLGSSAGNIGLSLAKDRAFSRMYGVSEPRPVPKSSLTLFGIRDSMTILASFTLTKVFSELLQKKFALPPLEADVISQLTLPISMQILSTPIHLLGSDLYNRPDVTKTQRQDFIKKEYGKTLAARMMRIFPAYGIGGLANIMIRKTGHQFLYNHK